MIPVTVLFDDGKLMAVRGLKPGETVVTDGQLLVTPGIKVRVQRGHGGAKAAAAAQ